MGKNRARANSVAWSIPLDAVPATTMSPLDCTAAAIGVLLPLVKKEAVVVLSRVPLDVYLMSAKVSTPGRPLLFSPVTTAMLPLDCSIAVKVVAVTPRFAVTVPPLPKVVSRAPAWAYAELEPNARPSANSPAIASNVAFLIALP